MFPFLGLLLLGSDRGYELASFLDAWASRFERCELRYRIDPKAQSVLTAPFTEPTSVRLRTYEGYAEVTNMTISKRMAVVTPSLAYTLMTGDTGLGVGPNVPQWRRYSGAQMGREVDRQRSIATRDVRAFGGVPSGTRSFRSWLQACERYEYTEKGDVGSIRFVNPDGFVKGVSLIYSYDFSRRMPTAVEIVSLESRIRWVIAGRTWNNPSDLMRSKLWIIQENGKPELVADYVLDAVSPLVVAPPITPPSDVIVLDEATAEVLYDGRQRFSRKVADQVVDAAKAKRVYKMTEFASAVECGPLCVYFLERLLGRSAEYRSPNGKDALESLADLARLAQNHGVRVKALYYPPDQPLPDGPWIAHVAPSHFVVVSGTSDDGLIVVDPSAGVSVVSEQTFREAWSGYAICPD